MEGRMLLSGRVNGYPDLDVTEDQFYPVENYTNFGSMDDFVSIYSLEGGLELTGQYFFTGSSTETFRGDVFLNGNNLLRTFRERNSRLYGYNHELFVDITNIPNMNDNVGSFGSRYTGLVSYTVDLTDFPSNNPPTVSDASGTPSAD